MSSSLKNKQQSSDENIDEEMHSNQEKASIRQKSIQDQSFCYVGINYSKIFQPKPMETLHLQKPELLGQ